LRPKDFSKYYILWEANWEDPPGDPVLLKHIEDEFYAILAAWDLTQLEQEVLRSTRKGSW
jgi:hypothetical protein